MATVQYLCSVIYLCLNLNPLSQQKGSRASTLHNYITGYPCTPTCSFLSKASDNTYQSNLFLKIDFTRLIGIIFMLTIFASRVSLVN